MPFITRLRVPIQLLQGEDDEEEEEEVESEEEECEDDEEVESVYRIPRSFLIIASSDDEEEEEEEPKKIGVTFTHRVYETSCPICCEEYKKGEELIEYGCEGKHVFHHKCIQKWNKMPCPMCRENPVVKRRRES